ncbi:uncharacterized protein [Dermacentor andersoni]|uniref:uncharacterized protein isoform X3 n=1 Tax=Dermacentor andersoni TaxID=34620 RepID=UPI003B3B05B2
MKGNQTVTDTYATRVNSARSPRKRSRMRNTVVTAAECCRGLAADDVAASAVCVEWGPRAACGVSSSATICAPSQAIRVLTLLGCLGNGSACAVPSESGRTRSAAGCARRSCRCDS